MVDGEETSKQVISRLWNIPEHLIMSWLEKKLKAQSRGLGESFTAEEMRAGQEAVQIIQRMSREIYETADGRTLEELGDV